MTCKHICFTISATFMILLVIILVRTFTVFPRKDAVIKCKSSDADFIAVTDDVLKRFQQVLKFRTVSTTRGVFARDQLDLLNAYLKKSFPVLHSSPLVSVETVANYSLLYSISGSNKSLTPYMLMAHLDVVPAIAEDWELPPFEGQIKDGYINGRGTIDFKQGVVVSGYDGAHSISQVLQSRGLKQLEFILDEGLTVTNGFIPGLNKTVALIGTGEKGYLTIKLYVKGEAGHSSMPLKETAIGILAKAVAKLQDNPLPSMLGYGPEGEMLEHLAPEMSLPLRIVMSNLWLFKPIVSWVMSQKPSTNALIRTVTAVTMFNGGVKTNVLPSDATAYVNHRIHPAQTVQEVIDYDRDVIDDDRVEISADHFMEPQPGSPAGENDFGYQTVSNSIRQIWTDAATAPGTMIGNTDTRHYKIFTKNIYRFSPTVMFPGDEKRFHGVNERISIKNYEQAINFYYHVMLNADNVSLLPVHKHSDEL